MANAYPHRVRDLFKGIDQQTEDNYVANLLYLEELGLVESGLTQALSGDFISVGPKINAKGIDFLADEGGVSAILGTVTIRIHEDTIRQLIAKRIDESTLPPEEKVRLRDRLKDLEGKTFEHLTMKLLDVGLSDWGKVLTTLQSTIGL
ncbi:hypothetical protein [Herminiimonas contaminans]|uniref:Uncharacterized protein n=1 Tax=Herminiimonas contaminans TaxID=1111140 RepID=A0ABS0EY17_9BURK|nr:hypothetical protein [Herminiimonas contaminans]MBF8179751.1 hypothetical protein [Herminiimonas contaminans]